MFWGRTGRKFCFCMRKLSSPFTDILMSSNYFLMSELYYVDLFKSVYLSVAGWLAGRSVMSTAVYSLERHLILGLDTPVTQNCSKRVHTTGLYLNPSRDVPCQVWSKSCTGPLHDLNRPLLSASKSSPFPYKAQITSQM